MCRNILKHHLFRLRGLVCLLLGVLIFGFLFYLRHNGEYFEVHCPNRHEDNTVTKIIHQSWKDSNIPEDFQRYQPSWKKCFPTWQYKFWTDEDNRNFVKQYYSWFLPMYDSFPKNIYRADVARYFYLFHYGGIYTDLDNECLFPFEHLLQNFTFVFGTIDNVNRRTPLPENYVQNSFMYSKPKQQFWLDLIKSIKHRLFYPSADIITGPEALCKVIHRYRTQCYANHGVKIYDAWYFNPISWGGFISYKYCRPVGRMNDTEWINCREEFKENGSYVVQYHAHTWG